jgi:hypothetical protein
VGTKVMDHLRACVKVADYCDPSSADTITFIKTLETVLRAFCHHTRMIRNNRSFLLFW